MQYCSLQHQTLLASPVTSVTGHCLRFGSLQSFWSYSSSLLQEHFGHLSPGKFIFQCHIFFPFHTVHGVLKARMLKWFAIPFSSGSHFVRTFHHDPSVFGGPTCELNLGLLHYRQILYSLSHQKR